MPDSPHHFVAGRCIICDRLFTFDPQLVPSHPIRDGRPSANPTDPKGPICDVCIPLVNRGRANAGLPTWDVPAGAYGPREGLPE